MTSYSPLVGGCAGGSQVDVNDVTTIIAHGGAGGGAIQFASATQIALAHSGLIDLGGGGGQSSSGGGSGGTLILEAPMVSIIGPSAGIVANGGAGGGCSKSAPDASLDGSPALGPVCANYFGGNGGTGTTPAGHACRGEPGFCSATECPTSYGGGGGSVGRARIVTADGTYAATDSPLFNVHIETATLTQ